MADSTDTKITYKAIQDRAKADALEAMPDLPKENTVEAWESFIADVEAIDAYEVAHESSEWDWVIYYGRAMELCLAVPNDVLADAEGEWIDMGGSLGVDSGLFEFASTLAALVVYREVVEALESCKEEMLELANSQLDNLGDS